MRLLAHAGRAVAPHDLWGAWTLDPVVLATLTAIVLLYAHWVRGRRHAGGPGTGVSRRQIALFSTAVLVLVVALVSPLDALGESLFAAHMAQHLLLTLVAGPLLLLGRAHLAVLPVIPLRLRRRGARRIARGLRRASPAVVVAAVGAHLGTVVLWHVPVLYDAALRQSWLHATEHASLLVTAVAFWGVMGAARSRPVAVAGLAAFVASLVSVLLAATMTVATSPWHTSHLATAPAWGLTPLRDQHMAAAIMWVPGGLVYLGAAAVAVFRWIRADEQRLRLQRGSAPWTP